MEKLVANQLSRFREKLSTVRMLGALAKDELYAYQEQAFVSVNKTDEPSHFTTLAVFVYWYDLNIVTVRIEL